MKKKLKNINKKMLPLFLALIQLFLLSFYLIYANSTFINIYYTKIIYLLKIFSHSCSFLFLP